MSEFFEWREAPPGDFAVIGDPVGHSRSPRMHTAAYEALGLPYRYVAIRVPVGEVAPAFEHLKGLGYRGVNVTVPHKAEANAWAGSSSRSGSVNTVNLATGEGIDTDGLGFLDTLRGLGVKPPSKVLMLGAGGTARALAAVLPGAGYSVKVWNRTGSRAGELAEEFGLEVEEYPSADFDLVVNTTSAGLTGDRIPIDWSRARAGMVAYDLVYGDTPFLQEAAQLHLRRLDGKALLVAQGARAFEWWLGIEPPRDVMMDAIR